MMTGAKVLPELLVDSRVGSRELIPHLGEPKTLTRLEYADVAFLAPNGITVGVERKTITDFLGSMATGRLSGHQFEGLQNAYSHPFVVIEGKWDVDGQGVLGKWRGKGSGLTPITLGKSPRVYHYAELVGFCLTMDIVVGIRPLFTPSLVATCRLIEILRKWFAKSEHVSHLQKQRTDVVRILKPSLVYRVACELPCVDHKRAKALERVFPNVRAMVLAGYEELQEVEGIGKTIARRVADSWLEKAKGVSSV